MNDTEIKCPKCGSNQIIANKKDFRSKKDFAEADITKGSKNMKIICQACGKEFRLGEDKLVQLTNKLTIKSIDESFAATESVIELNKKIIELYKSGSKLAAVKFCKENTDLSLKEANDYVENLASQLNLTSQYRMTNKDTKGCFIATACYGDYNAPEVITLRLFRDQKLLKTIQGRIFIRFYYTISPPIANLILKSPRLQQFIRNHFLSPLVIRFESNQD